MKDERGLYYFPIPYDHKTRVYIRENSLGDIEFRLWVDGNEEIWNRHPWLSYEIIEKANELYKNERNKNMNNLDLYDLKVAKILICDDEKNS